MNNKVRGMQFEREICKVLSENGYWVHFMSPDNKGAQPFDIIAVKDGMALAADCKTCKDLAFPISRLEDNQVMAFERWMECGNVEPVLFVKHDEVVYLIPYGELKAKGKVRLNADYRWK